jgi:prolipoprotein diacylglyceryltransferase
VIILAIVAIVGQRKTRRPPDYRTLFIMGVIWLAIGIPIKSYAMSALGLILAALGLANRKRWKETSTKWGDWTREEKMLKVFLIVVLSVLVIGGLVLYFLARKH